MREHLIVVVPGIGGSVLAPAGRPAEPVWSLALRDLDVLRHPERLSLEHGPELEPIGLVSSFKIMRFWTAIHGYETLLKTLGAPHPTVLPAPYDFRQSVAESARHLDRLVRDRLRELWPNGDHAGRMIIVAHSMGGLVARYWLAPGLLRGDGPGEGPAPVELCKALITLGTPYRGAPKALDILANGVRVAGVAVAGGLTEVLRSWPSMAQLLPRYPAVVDASAPAGPGSGRLLYPYELSLPWRTGAKAAYDLHTEMEQAWKALPVGMAPDVVPRIGYGHGTLRRCVWDGQRVTVSKDAPAWPGLRVWDTEFGDGTVPAFSGLPLEMDRHAHRNLLVRARHGQLGNLEQIKDLIDGYEGRDIPDWFRGGEPDHPPTIGLDLDETQIAGEPFDIAARMTGVDPQPASAVWASVIDPRERRRVGVDVPLVWDEEQSMFRGRIPGLPAGGYLVQVSAPDMPGVGDHPSSELVEVIDDEHL